MILPVTRRWSLRRDRGQTRPLGGAAKRGIDILIALSALIMFSPLFLLVAITIAVCDGRPVFYRHSRVGHRRQPFHCLKFRTMVANGDEVLRRHLEACPDAQREWIATRKLKDDPRITVVGAVLRKLSLDELPQLVNVLRGDMSIVGPRPIVVDEITMYGADAHFYFQVRPGLTGPWQVSGRNDAAYDGRVALDRAYVENWSIRRDVMIILKTIPVVLTARGSY
ncbi:MAG TPA: sugar transferase [Xanthobacteraceae bacterium]|nr:sugar transferase [Xanthobacteraceae bacterium]